MYVESYSCKGYDDFFNSVSPKIDLLCTKFFGSENYSYQSAVLEAVYNAARYSVSGVDNADIHFRFYISDIDIKLVILSKTKDFNAREFRDRLYHLIEISPKIANTTWGEFTQNNTDGGRGFWIMLQACKYVIVNYKGQEVTLIATKQDSSKNSRQIKDLLPKFLIEENGAVS